MWKKTTILQNVILYLIARITKENCFINIKYLTQNFLQKKNIIIRVLLIIYMIV